MESISRSQLVEELRVYEAQCADLVEFFTINEGWHGAAKLAAHRAEMEAVRAFLAQLESAAAAPEAASTRAKKVRCAWYRDIRRAFAIAREVGCDTKADEAMRAAFSRFLGRTIESREALDGYDWVEVGDAMKAGLLAW